MKNKILEELIINRDNYISGAQISEKFNVSRTAVWKYINQLRRAGYIIESKTNKGYRLKNNPDTIYCHLPIEKNILKTLKSFVKLTKLCQ